MVIKKGFRQGGQRNSEVKKKTDASLLEPSSSSLGEGFVDKEC